MAAALHISRELLHPVQPVRVNLQTDPESERDQYLVLTVTTSLPLEAVAELDDRLQEKLFEALTPRHHFLLSFEYRFV